MKKKYLYLIIGLLIIFLVGCENKNYLNGEYVFLDGSYVSYKCNKESCDFDMSSVFGEGDFVKQTYAYQLEEKGKNIYRVNFINKENGQEHSAIWNKEEDSLYVEDLKIKCNKPTSIGKEVKTNHFSINFTRLFANNELSYDINEFDNSFLVSEPITQNNKISAIQGYNFLGFEFTFECEKDVEEAINIKDLLSLYDTEFSEYKANELWWYAYKETTHYENEKFYFKRKEDVIYTMRGYFTYPDNENIYLKVNDGSNAIYKIDLN